MPARIGALLGVVLAGVLSLGSPMHAEPRSGPYEGTKESLGRHPVPQWWRDAKFGIFIHWGPYAVPAWAPKTGLPSPVDSPAEWYWFTQQMPSPTWLHHLQTHGPSTVYDDFLPRFRAERYDPQAWAQLMKDVGAKYFILTTKHHDGYSLFPSATTGRDAAAIGPKRDLVGPLVNAARQRGLKVGLYYSIPEWFNPAPNGGIDPHLAAENPTYYLTFPPGRRARNAYTGAEVPYTGYRPTDDYAAGHVRPQLRELIRRYHPDELWCDLGGSEKYFHSNEIIAEYYNKARETNPGGVVVNDRCGDSRTHRDYATVESTSGYGGEATPSAQQTETVTTMGYSWGYDSTDTLNPAQDLVHRLVRAVANNSNFVLNIGPRPDGTIPQGMTTRLREIGAWLDVNGEAIYRSRPWSQSTDGGGETATRFTLGANRALYAMALSWPGKQLRITAPVPIRPGSTITLLGSDGKPLSWHKEGTDLVIDTPAGGQGATTSKFAFTFKITGLGR